MEMLAGVQERRAIYGKTDQLSMHFIRNLRMCREELESSAFPLQGERSSNWSYRYLEMEVENFRKDHMNAEPKSAK